MVLALKNKKMDRFKNKLKFKKNKTVILWTKSAGSHFNYPKEWK